jgi:group I intron endonuclease
VGRGKSYCVRMPNGKDRGFESLRQLCAALGVSYRRAHKRLGKFKKKLSPKQLYEVVTRENDNETPIDVTMPDGSVRRFESTRKGALFFKLNPVTVWKRLDRGLTPEQAFRLEPLPKRKSAAAKPFVFRFNGKTYRYRSMPEAAEAHGQSPAAVKDRLRRRWSKPQALRLEDSGRPPHKIAVEVLDGGRIKTFASRTAFAKAYGKDIDLVNQRLTTLGWSPEEAVELVPRPGHKRPRFGLIYVVTHKASGRQYVGQTKERTVRDRWKKHIEEVTKTSRKSRRPLIEAIRKYGPGAFTFKKIDDAASLAELNEKERHWINKLGTLIPRGFNRTRGGQGLETGKSVKVRDKTYRTLTDASTKLRTPLSTASRRLKEGRTPEQAFGLEPIKKRTSDSRRQPIAFEHAGRRYEYNSKRDAARAHGVPEKQLYRRLKDRWPIQEALNLVKKARRGQKRSVRTRLDGKIVVYPSEAEAARANGQSPTTFKQRLDRGWPVSRALREPPGKQGRRRINGGPNGR